MITDDISPLGGYAGLWLDRRVKIGYETAEELAKHYNPLNFRGHPENQRDATEESLDALGYVGQVKKSLHSGVILDGHLRIEIALAKDPAIQLPVDYYDLTPDEELLALQVLDTTTEMAEPIADKLAALMERTKHLTADKPGLAAMLEQLKMRAGVNGNGNTPKDIEPQIDKAAELQKIWGTQLGQVWELGQHRLACGDCTDRAVVEAVMRGEMIEACIADPPYGLGKDFENDDERWSEVLSRLLIQINPQALLYIFCAALPDLWRIAWDIIKPDRVIIWHKPWNMQYPSQGIAWHFEPILFRGSNNQREHNISDVISVGAILRRDDPESEPHPTQKPIELLMEIINHSSGLVLDPFLGSGTTLIACENLNRRCRAVEIDPGYVGVTLERFFQLTGKEPVLLSK